MTKFATFIGSPSMNMIEAKITNISGELYMETNDGISVLVPKHKINSLAEEKEFLLVLEQKISSH